VLVGTLVEIQHDLPVTFGHRPGRIQCYDNVEVIELDVAIAA
jgi:hypothetical protein